MKKAVKVLFIYLLALLACSLLFNWLGIKSNFLNLAKGGMDIEVSTMLIPTIIGGIVALKFTIPARSLKFFLVAYFSLWVLRLGIIYIANQLGEIHLFNRAYRFDLIIANYYKTVSRLDTPLPFVLYWFINYLFLSPPKPPVTSSQQV